MAAKQLLISVKFNKDIFADEKTPADSLKFYLTDENGTVYDEYFYKEKQKFDYRYIRLCFENVELNPARFLAKAIRCISKSRCRTAAMKKFALTASTPAQIYPK